MAATNWDGVQRRSSPRVALTLDLLLLRSRGAELSARTIDVSNGGARISCDRTLELDELLDFDLSLGSNGTPGHVDGRARVLRMQEGNEYALHFEHIGSNGFDMLNSAVAQAG
jgi:c-di-GMP-binding flagellar brake protein YcgR